MTLRLVDCRPRDDYLRGHLPGAAHLDREDDLTGNVGDASHGRHPLPTAAGFEAAVARAGIGEGTFVLAYDSGEGWAHRLWWLLRHFGHGAAGTIDFRSYAGPLQSGDALVPAGRFVARERSGDTIDADEIKSRLGNADFVLVDARSRERWRGDAEPLDPVAGRIPGSRNAYFEDELPADLLTAPELVVYCGSGVSACVPLQRLILAGREDARLYPGSFSEWCRRDGYPIEKGD